MSKANTDDEDAKLTEFFQSVYKNSNANKVFIKDLSNSFGFIKDHFSSIKSNQIMADIAKHISNINLVPHISFPVNDLERVT